jgi:predicted nucleotidyltransferase
VRGNWDETANVPPQQLDADTILRALREHKVEFVVIGDFAVAFHGFPRATKEVDIVPAQDPENHNRLFEALARLGAQPLEISDFRTEELPVPFTREGLAEGGNWALATSAGRVDILQWIPGVEGFEQLRSSAVEADVPGVGALLFAGYEDLVAMKRAAGRAEDQRDLDELRAIREEP